MPEQARLAEPQWAGVPVVSRVPAGLPTIYEVERYAEEALPLDAARLVRPGEALFGLRVAEDSNEPWMYAGDIVICSGVQAGLTFRVQDERVGVRRTSTGERWK